MWILWVPRGRHGGPLEALWVNLFCHHDLTWITSTMLLYVLNRSLRHLIWRNPFLQQSPQVFKGRSGLLCFFVRFGGCPKRFNARNIYPTQKWIFPSSKKFLLSYAKATIHDYVLWNRELILPCRPAQPANQPKIKKWANSANFNPIKLKLGTEVLYNLPGGIGMFEVAATIFRPTSPTNQNRPKVKIFNFRVFDPIWMKFGMGANNGAKTT